jgi:hypothetical protein
MKRIGVVIGTPLEDGCMRTLCLSLIICALTRAAPIAQATDPLVATWTVNMARSKYDPGPAPKSLTMMVKPSEQGYTITQDEVAANGQQSHVIIILRPDGKEYPVEGRANTTVATTRINPRTYERVTRVNGKVTLTSRTVVSADGKTRTTTTTGTDAQGNPVHELVIYDRK